MKYIIRYNVGYGDEWEIIDTVSFAEAEKWAEEEWEHAVDRDYEAYEYSDELAKENMLDIETDA